MPAVTLNLDENNLAVLVRVLENRESVLKYIANMIHTTPAERDLVLNEAAVCQMAYLQLEGGGFKSPSGAPDWSKSRSEAYAAVAASENDEPVVTGDIPPLSPTLIALGMWKKACNDHYNKHSRTTTISDCNIKECRAAYKARLEAFI